MIRVLFVLALSSLAACATLPPVGEREATLALPAASSGLLAQRAAAINAGTVSGESAFEMLYDAEAALRWRLALVDNAVSSIDAQYFIWKDDPAGSLLLQRVLAAADRGVRVRLLVDDMFLSTGGAVEGADTALAATAFHPNVEIRLFNPGRYRSGILGLAGNFGGNLKEYNRRMHNKLMVVDGHFALVGGRNIGDEYYGLHGEYNFLDLDVLVIGAALPQASAAFDEYWNADLAYPADLLAGADSGDHREVRRELDTFLEQSEDLLAAYQAPTDNWVSLLDGLPAQLKRGFALFLQDEPVQRGDREYRLYDMLGEIAGQGYRELLISSPYLIPVDGYLEALAEDSAYGVRVQLLTNSLASNDAVPAHSHYKKYRRPILASGAELYEFHHQPSQAVRERVDVAPVRGDFVALHIKAGVADSAQCYIGSLNLDPRSVVLNTENLFYFESEALCRELHGFLAALVQSANAWQVQENADGELEWLSYEGRVSKQPVRSGMQRLADFFFRLLPLETQL